MRGLTRTLRGIATVARRRGAGYGWYLISGVLWPRLAYGWVWGPQAASWLRPIFELFGSFASQPAAAALGHAHLLADISVERPTDTLVRPDELKSLLDSAHAHQIAGVHGAFDAVVALPGGRVVFGEVPSGARVYRRRGVFFCAARDADCRALNARFGEMVLTEAEARRRLRALQASVPAGYRDYAPIDFGGGLSVGQIASTDSGTGRWDFFNRHVVAPLVAGRRVVDLGSNNGSLPLMMLRAGAAEVIAIEAHPAIAEFARLNARILEWRDIRRYRIQVLRGDMRLFLDDGLGPFDVVTAFCSLYYLPEEDMARVVARAASMRATLILQANDAISNLPATTAQLQRLMTANGYPDVRVYAPAGFARPLLVGAPAAIHRSSGNAAGLTSPVGAPS